MPLASWCRWRPLACPSAPTSVASGTAGQLADGGDAEPLQPGQRGRADAPQGLRPAAGAGRPAPRPAPPRPRRRRAAPRPARPSAWPPRRPAWPAASSWPRPTEQASASSSVDLAPDRRRRSSRPRRTAGGAPVTSRKASSREMGSTSGVYDRNSAMHLLADLARRARGRRAGRRPRGTGAGPARTAWPSGCRSAGPRRTPPPRRPGGPCRPRRRAGRRSSGRRRTSTAT